MRLWRFIFLTAIFGGGIAKGQENYRIILVPANYTFYCGIVNDCRLPIVDTSTPRRTFQFQAISDGAQLSYDELGTMKLLPKNKSFSIKVYGENNKKVYYIGKITATCKEPPLEDGNFQKDFPNPQKGLKRPKKFSVQGKLIVEDPSLYLDYTGGFAELTVGKESLIAVKVLSSNNGDYSPVSWKDIEVRSADADIREEEKHVMGVTPKSGLRNCKLEIYMGDVKIGEENLKVNK